MMHTDRFDASPRSFGDSSRRSMVVLSLGRPFTTMRRSSAKAQSTPDLWQPKQWRRRRLAGPPSVRTRYDGLQSRTPGELVAFEEITPADDPRSHPEPGWRVLYVSTGRDNTERTLICGVVVAPDTAERIFAQTSDGDRVGRVGGVVPRHARHGPPLSAIHATGPRDLGADPYGINQVAWEARPTRPAPRLARGRHSRRHHRCGWIVAASDYFVGLGVSDAIEPWVVGKLEAANTVDNIRAAHHLLTAVYEGYAT